MKVLMVDSAIGTKYAISLCNALMASDVDVTLISVEDIKNEGFLFKFFPYSPSKHQKGFRAIKLIKYLFYLFWLLRFIRKMDFDVVHFQFLRRARLECLIFPILKIFQRNIIFTAHNVVPHENGRIDYWLRGIVYRNVSKIIVHTASIKDNLLKTFQVRPSKIYIVPPINPLPKDNDQMLSQNYARKTLGLKTDDLVVLFFGFIRPYKGVDLLLEAFESVNVMMERAGDSHGRNIKLLIAGKPLNKELENELLSIIENMKGTIKKNIKAYFHFIKEEDIEAFFRAADIIALPYRHIDYSAVSDHAAMYARPVISTNVGDFQYSIAEKGIGFVADKNDVEAFTKTLLLSLHDLNRLKAMGTRAYQLYVEENSHEKVALKTVQTYQHAM